MRDDERRKFSEWVRNSREELNLTEDELAERLGVALDVVLMWEVGNSSWALLPKEYKNKLQELFGSYSDAEQYQVTTEFRQGSVTAFADDIEQEVLRILADEKSNSEPGEVNLPSVQPIADVDCVEAVCGCGTQIWVSNDGRCPNCQKRMDPSQ